jgi:hypothetical protein
MLHFCTEIWCCSVQFHFCLRPLKARVLVILAYAQLSPVIFETIGLLSYTQKVHLNPTYVNMFTCCMYPYLCFIIIIIIKKKSHLWQRVLEMLACTQLAKKKSRFRGNWGFNISRTNASALPVQPSLHPCTALINALLFIRSCNWLSVLSL